METRHTHNTVAEILTWRLREALRSGKLKILYNITSLNPPKSLSRKKQALSL